MKCARLEQELRKSKRREEKLTALQYRLKEDVQLMGADARSAPPCLLANVTMCLDTCFCLVALPCSLHPCIFPGKCTANSTAQQIILHSNYKLFYPT